MSFLGCSFENVVRTLFFLVRQSPPPLGVLKRFGFEVSCPPRCLVVNSLPSVAPPVTKSASADLVVLLVQDTPTPIDAFSLSPLERTARPMNRDLLLRSTLRSRKEVFCDTRTFSYIVLRPSRSRLFGASGDFRPPFPPQSPTVRYLSERLLRTGYLRFILAFSDFAMITLLKSHSSRSAPLLHSQVVE